MNAPFLHMNLIKESDPRAFEEQIQSLTGQLDSPGWDYRYYLQKISDIHLHSNLDRELKQPGDPSNLLIFSKTPPL